MSTYQNPSSDIGTQFYATQLGTYDEMYATEHNVLPYWQKFITSLEAMGGEELERRRREAQRLLRENGVTYNVYGESENLSRTWKLDPLPLLIGSDEWQTIEAGLKQRAILFDLILKDIYGAQILLKKGILPAELVMGHEGFLHPCVGTLPSQKHHLTIYSANLARGPDGHMWILDDRTQAPSGFGYALENRAAIARVLPEIFRETHVRRLSGFFQTFNKALANIALQNKDNPRIVVLTPGPFNETYFEHAYLASYLGFTLVQGDDLTVRDGRVLLKSLDGLKPVDVILRRLDDSYCDPLELKSNSRLGVAGLLEAVRRGNVSIANPLGSSVLENPGLLAFLPRLAQYFLNQELILHSVATWWCGQPRERDFVLQNIEHLVIKQVNRKGHGVIFGSTLTEAEKRNLQNLIKAKPHLYVGQEQVSFSTSPAFIDKQIEHRNSVLRNFVVADGEDYLVMPGGLTRIAKHKDDFIVSNQAGGLSKDTWVLGTASESGRASSVTAQINRNINTLATRVTEPLTSRAADNLFWVGRYLERSEVESRVLKTILEKIREVYEFQDELDVKCLHVLLKTLTHITGTYPGFVSGGEALLKNPQAELLSFVKDGQRMGSLTANVSGFFKSAFNIRDLWSQDTWRSVDTIHRRWEQKIVNADVGYDQLQGHLDELILGTVAFSGLITDSLTREAGWLMLDSGRRLERALLLTSLLRATLALRHEEALLNQLLESVLISTDSLTIYLRRYRASIQLPMVLALLLMDESHPRSIAYQLAQLSNHIKDLPKECGRTFLSEEERLILKAYTDVRLSKVSELLNCSDECGVYNGLEHLFSEITDILWRLADLIAESYFSHSQTSQLLVVKSKAEDEL